VLWEVTPRNHDPYLSILIQQFLANKMAVIPHQPYTPDLAPGDFFLFPKMKLKVNRCQFNTTEENPTESQRVLDTLTVKYFQDAFQK
jgi:hypothetical protein